MRALAIVVTVAACSSKASPGPPTAPTIPRLAVALTDHGLRFSPSRVPAARYRISFTDRRGHPTAGEHVELAIGPESRLALLTVPLGTSRVGILLEDDTPFLMINGLTCVRMPPRPADCALGDSRSSALLSISASREYPTPAT